MSDPIRGRIEEAERVIRAQNRLIQAMYDSDGEAGWPQAARHLQGRYEQEHAVRLDDEPGICAHLDTIERSTPDSNCRRWECLDCPVTGEA